MVVYRDESIANGSAGKEEDLLDVMDVELTKKPGKGLGLSIVGRKNGTGIFISDIVSIFMWPAPVISPSPFTLIFLF